MQTVVATHLAEVHAGKQDDGPEAVQDAGRDGCPLVGQPCARAAALRPWALQLQLCACSLTQGENQEVVHRQRNDGHRD